MSEHISCENTILATCDSVADSKKASKEQILHRTSQKLKLKQMLLYIVHGSLVCHSKHLVL